jgi:hypothetical protein
MLTNSHFTEYQHILFIPYWCVNTALSVIYICIQFSFDYK